MKKNKVEKENNEQSIEKSKKMVKKEKIKQRDKVRKGSYNIFKVNGEFKLVPLIINILIPLVGGFIVGYLNSDTMGTYEMLKKPFFSPPGFIFPIVWSILYILMGIAAYRIYMRNKQGADDNGAYFFYLVQLIINFLWSFVFFTFKLYGIAFIVLVILFVLIIITYIKFTHVDKIAGILLIPYILWVAFAGVLNFFIYVLNEM